MRACWIVIVIACFGCNALIEEPSPPEATFLSPGAGQSLFNSAAFIVQVKLAECDEISAAALNANGFGLGSGFDDFPDLPAACESGNTACIRVQPDVVMATGDWDPARLAVEVECSAGYRASTPTIDVAVSPFTTGTVLNGRSLGIVVGAPGIMLAATTDELISFPYASSSAPARRDRGGAIHRIEDRLYQVSPCVDTECLAGAYRVWQLDSDTFAELAGPWATSCEPRAVVAGPGPAQITFLGNCPALSWTVTNDDLSAPAQGTVPDYITWTSARSTSGELRLLAVSDPGSGLAPVVRVEIDDAGVGTITPLEMATAGGLAELGGDAAWYAQYASGAGLTIRDASDGAVLGQQPAGPGEAISLEALPTGDEMLLALTGSARRFDRTAGVTYTTPRDSNATAALVGDSTLLSIADRMVFVQDVDSGDVAASGPYPAWSLQQPLIVSPDGWGHVVLDTNGTNSGPVLMSLDPTASPPWQP